MLAIKSNIMAANAARQLGKSTDALAQSVQRLSSGLRITGAKDDAAGMAVSELVKADVATLVQGSRNAQDAISMLQSAEGALGGVDDLLVRMKQLAEQAATDSYSGTQRTIMDNEFQQLKDEITRVATSTTFNGIGLLNSSSSYNIHIGSSTTIDLTAQSMTANGLGLGASGTPETAVLNTSTANPNQSGFLVLGGADNFKFTFGGETQIDVSLAAGSYSMNALASLINAQSQTTSTYNAASIVYDSGTNMYSLKLSAKANGVAAAAFDAGNPTGLATADFTDNVGVAGGAVNILNKTNAVSALGTLTTAIGTKDSYRAALGYMMNRLQSAINVTGIQAENLQAAQSRITDVDVATETASLTSNQVLAQAGIAMLAQANSIPQMALKLLG